MNANQPHTLGADYFDSVYQANTDPWNFETSPYEHAKYADTLAALPRPRYERGFEIGCSLGVLTALLAPRCGHLLSVDIAEAALAQARRRCAHLPQVELRQMNVPAEFPTGTFELVVVSEVGYYWAPPTLHAAADRIIQALPTQGHLLLVHWTPEVHDYPLTGDEVHEYFLSLAADRGPLHHLHGHRAEHYRLDLLARR